jgi:hypothetical protein
MAHDSLFIGTEIQIDLSDHDTVQYDTENGSYKNGPQAVEVFSKSHWTAVRNHLRNLSRTFCHYWSLQR